MDPSLTVGRVSHFLDSHFNGLIDLDDVAGLEDKRKVFLTRALAANCIMSLTDADAESSAKCVTDGYNDLGLDAIYFDDALNTLYLVQSKWNQAGKDTIELGDCHKFLEGVNALIRLDFANANEKIQKRSSELTSIIMRPDVRISLILAYTSANPLGGHIENCINKFLADQNNVGDTDVFTSETFDLKRIYSQLGSSSSRNIKLQIGLKEWGTTDLPYRAYYGQVMLSDIARWESHGKLIFDKNLRFYRGSTEVNDAMENTVANSPECFWYFNNGITILCNSISKAALNGKERDFGTFECQGVSIVNGAQTVGVIWDRARKEPHYFNNSKAKVHVRLISLENCPEGFDAEVTRATNTQNEIKHRDFAALDEVQRRLAHEMTLDGKKYTFKSGDEDPKDQDGCTIEEATVALACADRDVTLATLAKREVGSLWKDVSKPPYTDIFSQKTTARDMWRAVLIYRAVNQRLKNIDFRGLPRGEAVAVHGNRYILHLVFQDPTVIGFKNSKLSESEIQDRAIKAVNAIAVKVIRAIDGKYPNAYLQTLFKNAQKCEELLNMDAPAQRTLFDETSDGPYLREVEG
ncbi:MAG: AIPR family protein [Alphaproteobacteria bacterium]